MSQQKTIMKMNRYRVTNFNTWKKVTIPVNKILEIWERSSISWGSIDQAVILFDWVNTSSWNRDVNPILIKYWAPFCIPVREMEWLVNFCKKNKRLKFDLI